MTGVEAFDILLACFCCAGVAAEAGAPAADTRHAH